MSLKENLLKPELSRDREELINYRLFYEIKKHGLKSGVDYELFPPVIDKNGYDLLVKHGRNIKAFQIKTVAKTSKTSNWSINKKFIRPDNIKDGHIIVRNFQAGLDGLAGGVIVVEYDVDENSELNLEYYYFDFQVLYFFQKRIFKWQMKQSYPEVVAEIFDDKSDTFKRTKTLLYKTEGIGDLLTISRIEPLKNSLTRENTEAWTFLLKNINSSTKTITINIKDIEFPLEIYDTHLTRKEIVIGTRVIKTVHKLE